MSEASKRAKASSATRGQAQSGVSANGSQARIPVQKAHRYNIFVALADRRGRWLWSNQFPEEENVWYYNRRMFDDVHPEDVDRVKDAFARCVIHGETTDVTMRAILYETPHEQTTKRYAAFQERFHPCDIDVAPHVAAVSVAHAIPEGVNFNDADMEVLKGLMHDRTIKEIADSLDKAQSTIDARVKSLKDRFGVQTLPGLVASAMRAYLID